MASDNGCIPRCAEHVEEIRDALIGTVDRPGFIHRTEARCLAHAERLDRLEAPAREREETRKVVVNAVRTGVLGWVAKSVTHAITLGVGIAVAWFWGHP